MKEIESKGKCFFCSKMHGKPVMSRHLSSHFKKNDIDSKSGMSYHLMVQMEKRYGTSPYFLHLWIDELATFADIDDYLKGIWLECCGHMSSFTIPKMEVKDHQHGMFGIMDAYDLLDQGKEEEYENMMADITGEIPMRKTLTEVFSEMPDKTVVKYEYDAGSSTNLELTLMGRYPIKPETIITLLSRNEPLKLKCEKCGKKNAVAICSVCSWEDVPSEFCEKCANEHEKTCDDFADYASCAVVNSPRMGVCAYDGGTIDAERD